MDLSAIVLKEVGGSKVVSIDGSASIEEALQVLQQQNVLSLPVRDGKEFIGILNLVDLIYATCFQPIFSKFPADKLSMVTRELLEEMRGAKAFDISCKDLLEAAPSLETKHPSQPYKATDALASLIDPFCTGVHRVLVLDDKTDEFFFVSQLDVIRHLMKHTSDKEVQNTLNLPLNKLGLGVWVDVLGKKSGVVTLGSDRSALFGFRSMIYNNELVALPVTDASGKLLATLSASDLRGLQKFDYVTLLLNVVEYLQGRNPGKKIRDQVVCTLDESLMTVTKRIIDAKVHRAWVVDNLKDKKVVGVVSLTDIIQKFSTALKALHQPPPASDGYNFLGVTRLQSALASLAEKGARSANDLARSVASAGDSVVSLASQSIDQGIRAAKSLGAQASTYAHQVLDGKEHDTAFNARVELDFESVCKRLESELAKSELVLLHIHDIRDALSSKQHHSFPANSPPANLVASGAGTGSGSGSGIAATSVDPAAVRTTAPPPGSSAMPPPSASAASASSATVTNAASTPVLAAALPASRVFEVCQPQLMAAMLRADVQCLLGAVPTRIAVVAVSAKQTLVTCPRLSRATEYLHSDKLRPLVSEFDGITANFFSAVAGWSGSIAN